MDADGRTGHAVGSDTNLQVAELNMAGVGMVSSPIEGRLKGSRALVEGVGELELLVLVEGVGELAVVGAVFGGGLLPAPGG